MTTKSVFWRSKHIKQGIAGCDKCSTNAYCL